MATATDDLPATARTLDRDQAAAAIGVSVRTLDQLDADHEGPRAVRIGRRRVYRICDIETWLGERAAAGV